MNKKINNIIVIIAFIIHTIIQVVGYIYSDSNLDILWVIDTGLILIIPLVFGLKAGLIASLPTMISEVVWYVTKQWTGPVIHGLAMLIWIVILGLLSKTINKINNKYAVLGLSCLGFEIGLLGEETTNYLLRAIFQVSSKPQLTWNNCSKCLLSLGNLICLVILIVILLVVNKQEVKQ